jgi:3-methyl-2-oxobutanoate hydroxymethyltransferase
VMHDLLGLEERIAPKFVKRYASLGAEATAAFARYVEEVRAGQFPTEEHSFSAPRPVALAQQAIAYRKEA